ncbi:MAG TPA: hypothetical protein VEL28_02330 [Candidatus Binatia bacterium]|nr:hypothetical protein [Candidatus Binatia bacterium]
MNVGAITLRLAALTLVLTPGIASAQRCDAMRVDMLGRYYSCVAQAQSKAVRSKGTQADPGSPKCSDVLASKWTGAETAGDCSVSLPSQDGADAVGVLTDALTELLAPDAQDTPSKCAALQLKAAGKYASCRLKVERGYLLSDRPRDFSKCDDKLASSFAKATTAADCLSSSDRPALQAQVSGDSDAIVALVSGTATTTTTAAPTSTTVAPTTTETTTSTSMPDGFDDDFEDGSLDPAWSVLHPSTATISVSGGQLHLEIDVPGNWYQMQESVLVYKLVTGDFDVHAPVHARRTSNPALPPSTQYRLGGLLARDPASSPGNSNFVHVAVGAGSNAVPQAAEWKNTDDSSSVYSFTALADTDVELRLTRVGNQFSMYYREAPHLSWQLLHTQARADLPATMQVGMMAYDPNGGVDMTASFDEIVFD